MVSSETSTAASPPQISLTTRVTVGAEDTVGVERTVAIVEHERAAVSLQKFGHYARPAQ